MEQEQEQVKKEALQEPAENYTRLLISFDANNSRQELKLIQAYCQQYRGKVTEIKESTFFCAATCLVPKDTAGDFKMKLQGHLESVRSGDRDTEGKNVNWV